MIPTTPASFTGLQAGGPSGVSIGRTTMPGGSFPRLAPGNVTQSGAGPVVHLHDGKHKRARCGPTHTVFRRVDSWEVKDSRRMNPLNPHALRRSLRRAGAFTKLVSKSLRFTKPGHHVKGFKRFGKKK
jgi:hypothetical protein